MPSLKSLILTIILALLIAAVIFIFSSQNSISPNLIAQTISRIQKPAPRSLPGPHSLGEGGGEVGTPSPKPTPPPLDPNTNLSTEINSLQIPNYTSDFQSLKTEVDSF